MRTVFGMVSLFFVLIFFQACQAIVSGVNSSQGEGPSQGFSPDSSPPKGPRPPFSDSDDLIPIIDFHAHIVPHLGKEKNAEHIDRLMELSRRAKVPKTVLSLHAKHQHDIKATGKPKYSPEHDQWIAELYKTYPDKVVPFIGGFDPADPQAPDYVEKLLKTGKWMGIGELDLRNSPKDTKTPANSDIMMEIYQIAADYQVPVLIHHDFGYGTTKTLGLQEMEIALSKNPKTTFVFAHFCPIDLMKQFTNLYCETEPTIKFPEEEELVENNLYQRVMLGTDVQSVDLKLHFPGGTMTYEQGVFQLRNKVDKAPHSHPHFREMILNGNAERLLR